MSESINTLLLAFRSRRDELEAYKKEHFPSGTVVSVSQPGRYCGLGISSMQDGGPPDLLPVRLENGNVWWYNLECCENTEEKMIKWVGGLADVPNWLKKEKRRKL